MHNYGVTPLPPAFPRSTMPQEFGVAKKPFPRFCKWIISIYLLGLHSGRTTFVSSFFYFYFT